MKRISYGPRKGDKYRVQIDGIPQEGPNNLLTKEQVLAQDMKWLADGHSLRISRNDAKGPRTRQVRSFKKRRR